MRRNNKKIFSSPTFSCRQYPKQENVGEKNTGRSFMKRQLIHLIVILPVLSLFFSLKIYAQSGTGELPATPKPTPTPKPSTRGTRPTSPTSPAPTPVSTTLTFGEERNGKLDPKTSDKGAAGSLYEELILNAKSDELITFHLESADSSIGLQILDKDNAEVAIARNPV